MSRLSQATEAKLHEVLGEVSTLMANAYSQWPREPDTHPLAQAGLEQGAEIVLDYLRHGEAGVAFEHLCYMIEEPPLHLSPRGRELLAALARELGRACPLP